MPLKKEKEVKGLKFMGLLKDIVYKTKTVFMKNKF